MRPCSTGESYSPASLWPYPKGGKCFPLAHSDSALLHAPPLLFRRGPPQPNYRKYSVRTSVTNVGLQLIRHQAWRRGGLSVPPPPPERGGRGGRDAPPTGRGTPTGVAATPFPTSWRRGMRPRRPLPPCQALPYQRTGRRLIRYRGGCAEDPGFRRVAPTGRSPPRGQSSVGGGSQIPLRSTSLPRAPKSENYSKGA